MPTLDINNAASTDMTNNIDDVTVDSKQLDGVSDQKETYWDNNMWSTWWGYFNDIPDLQSALIMKSVWNVGKGYETDNATKPILDKITGWGTDTFEDILFNMDLISNVGGDSFAEIIRNDKGTLVNLKPLDPSAIRIVVNRQGIIIRYEQLSKIKGGVSKKFTPDKILHFSKNRLGDQIHGISKISALKETIDAENESFKDTKTLMHHQVRPFIIFKLKTDDKTKINALINKVDDARNKGEDMFIPDDENILSYEVVQVNPSAMVLSWREDIRNKFYRTMGLPLVIFGSGGSTESGGKMEMFAHETIFNAEQRYIERQLWNQLAIKITLNSPVGLSANLQSDEAKDAAQGQEIQPQDTGVPTV